MGAANEGVELVVLGAGGHGSEIAAYVADMSPVRLAGFIDQARPAGRHLNLEVLGGFDVLAQLCARRGPGAIHYITAVGDNRNRKLLVEKTRALGIPNLLPWTLLHPCAHRGTEIEIGEGTCLAPGAIATTRASIGAHTIVNVKASVSHDCRVADFCNLNPGSTLCGNVVLGEGCYVGAGATIRQGVTIGAWTIIGAGTVVIGDLPAGVTAVGVPARIVKTHSEIQR